MAFKPHTHYTHALYTDRHRHLLAQNPLQFGSILGYWVLFFSYREPLPTVFSMLHPLDEIAPVVCKPAGAKHTHSHSTHFATFSSPSMNVMTWLCAFPGPFEGTRVQYASDATMTIVFSCCQPSLVVFYDTVQGIHSVWVLRKVTNDVSVQRGTSINGEFCLCF